MFPRLFKVLIIKPYDEHLLWDLDLLPDKLARVPEVLAAAKELCFSAPFAITCFMERDHARPQEISRCLHSFSSRVPDSRVLEEAEIFDYGLEMLAEQVGRLLLHLADNEFTSLK